MHIALGIKVFAVVPFFARFILKCMPEGCIWRMVKGVQRVLSERVCLYFHSMTVKVWKLGLSASNFLFLCKELTALNLKNDSMSDHYTSVGMPDKALQPPRKGHSLPFVLILLQVVDLSANLLHDLFNNLLPVCVQGTLINQQTHVSLCAEKQKFEIYSNGLYRSCFIICEYVSKFYGYVLILMSIMTHDHIFNMTVY